ncbi:hypothetical protein E2C01_050199 [Portunus trituberculatus]|uniref:Uncharacterized protein n=1 Tax=Portunus trituberculatus TaxID=210409 RepID=A0A5B7GF88_PORTR|nr:hypothetical protein [Portunus trituberculatus]
MNSLSASREEVGQPCCQVRGKTQTDVFVDDNSVVNQIKSFPEVHKSDSERAVSFIQVIVNEVKEAD